MQRRTNETLQAQRGSSTLEFIFCAPLLLIIMFIAMEINERIEHRVTSAIASGNAAWIIQADQSSLDPGTTTQVQALVTADILGTRVADHQNILGSPPGAMVADGQTIMSYTEKKRHAEAYTARIARRTDGGATAKADDRAASVVGDTKADHSAASLGSASASLNSLVRTITDPPVSWLPSAFPAKDIEEQRMTWSISNAGTTNLALSTIESLGKSLHGNITGDLQNGESPDYRILAHHSNYLRRYPAYHPRTHEYKGEMLVGMMLGLDDSDGYGSFVDECFMKFKSSICGQTNGFVAYVRNIHIVVTTVKTLVDSAAIACVAASLGTGAGACMIPTAQVGAVESVLEEAINETIKGTMESITNQITKSVTDALGKAVGDIKSKIQKNLGELRDKVVLTATDTLAEQEQGQVP